MFIMCRRYLI